MKRKFKDVKGLKHYITKQKAAGFSQACQLVVDINFIQEYVIRTTYDYFPKDPATITKVSLVR